MSVESNSHTILEKPLRSEISVDDFKTFYTVFTTLVLIYNSYKNISVHNPVDLDLTIAMFLISNFFVQRNNRYNPEFGQNLKKWIQIYGYATLSLGFVITGDMIVNFMNPFWQFVFVALSGLITISFTLYTRGKSLSFDEVQVSLNSLVEELYKNFPEIVDSLSENIENNGGLRGDYGKKVIAALKSTTKPKVPTDHKKRKKHGGK